MALVVKNNGEAVVVEPKTTAAANTAQPTAAADAGSAEKVEVSKPSTTTGSGATGTSVPENVTSGMSFNEVKAGLNQTYDSKWDEEIADLYNQIVQRKPFEYSADDDMLYQQYLQKYTQQGKQAMRDTVGQIAALTGGYGNSYGQVAGQQTYDDYLRRLNDLIPELQDAAYKQYTAEGDRLTQQYGMLTDMDDRARAEFQMNYGINADAYERLMSEAAMLGAGGDFSKYGEYFGADTAQKMQNIFNLQTLAPYIESGAYLMPGMQQLLAPLLGSAGINMNSLIGSNGGGGYGGGYVADPGAGLYTAWSEESDNVPMSIGAMGNTPEEALGKVNTAVQRYHNTGRFPGDYYT